MKEETLDPKNVKTVTDSTLENAAEKTVLIDNMPEEKNMGFLSKLKTAYNKTTNKVFNSGKKAIEKVTHWYQSQTRFI